MAGARTYTSRRQGIITALTLLAKQIDGTGDYLTDLKNNVQPRLLFWDEIEEWPAIHFNAGSETREYQGGGYKDRFLSVTARCYVNEEDSVNALDALLEDLETVIEEGSRLQYLDKKGVTQTVQDITIISIDTDEGVLDPLGVAEVLLEVRY
jgi:hypothetical protein